MAPLGDDPTKKLAPGGTGWTILVFYEGGSLAHTLEPGQRLVIGRAEDCELRIPHESVSRRHAVLSTERGWKVTDLGSSNGTFVGGSKLGEGVEAKVDPGVIIGIGSARLVIDWSAPPAAEAPRAGAEPANEAMDRVMRLVELVAKSALSVLILGETGSGKGWLAEEIHRRSPRATGPLVRLNCAALPEALLESELFGHEKGAFTGAAQAKAGILESAGGGTVFLDEIAEAPPSTQVKLLHALEHAEVTRVGATRAHAIDVRFVAATNRDVEAAMAGGQFRRDLYFRLAGVPIRLPPLRERTAEIPAMARGFAKGAALSPDALARLAGYAWPGNVRELRNVVERAVLLAGGAGVVRAEHVVFDDLRAHEPKPTGEPAATRSLVDDVRGTERARIVDALQRFGGNQGKAAAYLGISRRTLTNKLNELDLPRPRKGR